MTQPDQAPPTHELRVDWPQYYHLIEVLALKIHQSSYAFDSLLCPGIWKPI